MRRAFTFPLLFASLTSAAIVSGTIRSVEGVPLPGVPVKLMVGNATGFTDSAGAFALELPTTSVSRRAVRSDARPSRLTLENGRPRVAFDGRNLSGRAIVPVSDPLVSRAAGARVLGVASASPLDTLLVSWNGKRIFRIPVQGDTVVAVRMDTAWVDDGGIPWNPAIAYGSLRDSRDGRVYRTIVANLSFSGIETQWMAENLAHDTLDGLGSWCPMGDADSCRKHGRTYLWNVAMGLDTGWNHALAAKSYTWRGICPEGWRFPDYSSWSRLVTDAANAAGKAKLPSTDGGNALRSRTGWIIYRDRDGKVTFDFNGYDVIGMRLTPSGMRIDGQDLYRASENSNQWMSDEVDSNTVRYYNFGAQSSTGSVTLPKTDPRALSLRCWRAIDKP